MSSPIHPPSSATGERPTTRLPTAGLPGADDLRVRFPEHDFDGYWFFGGLRDTPGASAVMFGLSIGANDGYDWGFSGVQPDPDYGIYAAQLVGIERAIGFGRQPVHRHEFVYDRRALDLRIPDEARIAVDGDRIECWMRSEDGRYELDMHGTLAPHSYWTPDMVFRGTAFVSVAMPHVEFSGIFRDGDDEFSLDGIGVLDHPTGSVRRSDVSVGMGWWEYNCFMLDDAFGLFQWYIVDRAGKEMLRTVATTYPDGELHVGTLTLDYVDWEDRLSILVPKAWNVRAQLDHGTFEYGVRVVGPPWDGNAHVRGEPLPNFVLELDGAFEPNDGPTREVHGRGTGESVISERDPHGNETQQPW